MDNLTKLQAAQIALMIADLCISNSDCETCQFNTSKGCMLSDKNNEYIPSDWKIRQVDLFK